MRWTRSEQQTIEDLLESLGLPTSLDPIGLLPRPPSTLDRLRDDLLRPSEEDTTRRGLKSLRSFAHFIGVDVNEEFWELKCLLVALHEHPYFGRKGKADGRLRNLAVAEADLFEWWIEAWSLRAKLEFQRGKPVTDAELGVEMALRSRGLRDLDPDSLGSKEADEIERVTNPSFSPSAGIPVDVRLEPELYRMCFQLIGVYDWSDRAATTPIATFLESVVENARLQLAARVSELELALRPQRVE